MGPNSALARQFFDAVASGGDALAVCADNCVMSQNGSPERPAAKALVRLLAAFEGKVPRMHYEEPVVVDTENGFVEEHFACTTLPDGTVFRMPVVVVGVVRDGKIVSMHEYFDSAAAAPLMAALA